MRLFDETQRLFQQEQQRAAELAIVNSVQQASKLDFAAIMELVGNKLREIFDAQSIGIALYDADTDLARAGFVLEGDVRLYPAPGSPGPLYRKIINSHQPQIFHSRADYERMGTITVPGTSVIESGIYVPLVRDGQVYGVVGLENTDRSNAYSDSDLRLLSTLAGSMSVALENARLFDETQRLFQQEQQRAAELAIINSVQEGLASKLDFQGIIELVGDKLREVFNTPEIGIRILDQQTGLVHYLYEFEHGERLEVPPTPPGILWRLMVERRAPIVINRDAARVLAELRAAILPGTEMAKSLLNAPIIVGDRTIGGIALENYEREDAYSEADVRLLSTLASSLGVRA